MVAKRVCPVTWRAQHPACLFRQMSHRRVWRYVPASSRMMGDLANRTSSDRRHGLQQVTGLWIPMKSLSDLDDSLCQIRCGFGHRPGDLGQGPLRQRRDCPGHDRQQFAGGHADKRQKVLRSLVFALSFGRELAQVLHHSVRIDLADGADLVFIFIFAFGFIFGLVLVFAFSE